MCLLKPVYCVYFKYSGILCPHSRSVKNVCWPHSALREIITNCDNLPWCPVYLIWILNFNTCTFQTLTHDFTKSSKKKRKEGKCNTCGYMQMILWVSISHSKQFKTTPFLLKLLRPSVRRRGCFNQTAFWVTLSLKS